MTGTPWRAKSVDQHLLVVLSVSCVVSRSLLSVIVSHCSVSVFMSIFLFSSVFSPLTLISLLLSRLLLSLSALLLSRLCHLSEEEYRWEEKKIVISHLSLKEKGVSLSLL